MIKQPTIIYRKTQQGVALIVVLLVLVLIVLVGAIVVSKSNTDLRLATASQIDSALFVAAEQPNAMLEKAAEDPKSGILSSTSGVLGYFSTSNEISASNLNNSLIFCYRPKNPQLFMLINSAIYDKNGGKLDNNGNRPFCNVGASSDYTSGRNTTLTQMKITGGSASSGSLPVGVDLSRSNTNSFAIEVNTVSTIPSYSSANSSSINNCFTGNATTRGNIDSTISCLSSEGVPNTSVAQTYVAEYQDKVK